MRVSASMATLAIAVVVLRPGGRPLDFLVAGYAVRPECRVRDAALHAFLDRLGRHRSLRRGLGRIGKRRPGAGHCCDTGQCPKPFAKHCHFSIPWVHPNRNIPDLNRDEN